MPNPLMASRNAHRRVTRKTAQPRRYPRRYRSLALIGALMWLSCLHGNSLRTCRAACIVQQSDDVIVLGNQKCRVVWQRLEDGWSASFQCQQDGWKTVAEDRREKFAGYGILVKGTGVIQDYRYGRGPGGQLTGLPKQPPKILQNSPERAQLEWTIETPVNDSVWSIKSVYTVDAGDHYLTEEVSFHAASSALVRYERGWCAPSVDNDFFETVLNCVTHNGWTIDNASFLAIADQGPNGWDGTRGGGGFVRIADGLEWTSDGSFMPSSSGTNYTTLHRVPHFVEEIGWVDTGQFPVYTLRHKIMLWPGSLFDRDTVDYLHQIQPPQKLSPRYGWERYVELQVEGLQNAPAPLWDDHGDWGHHRLGWFNGSNDPKCTPPETFFQFGRQALDWGGNWDMWIAVAFDEYATRTGNAWARERTEKILRGVKTQLWQIDDPDNELCDGAIWMFRPMSSEEYQERLATKPSGEKGGTIHKGADLWICDAGKTGYWLCELYERRQDQDLLRMAKRAADFLFRQQQPDGNLRAGRLHVTGTVAYPANLATNSCAIMLWSRLYEITQEQRYRDAAIRCADYSIQAWLDGKHWKMYGGEWDVPGNNSTSTSAYATWGFATLYRATGYAPALAAVRRSADYFLAQQALSDTHFGFYMPKAYWRGRDARTTGGIAQGMHPEGYGQLLWVRPELPYAQYLAYTVTQDQAYLDSAWAYLTWMTYMQHNCPSDNRFHGGGSEGLEWSKDNLNGFGTVYIGETIGTDIALFKMLDLDK